MKQPKRVPLRRTLQDAEMTASVLRVSGMNPLGIGQRARIADLLDTLTEHIRRTGAEHDLDELPPMLPRYGATAEPDACQDDLLGGALG